jgi:hypothetical protein
MVEDQKTALKEIELSIWPTACYLIYIDNLSNHWDPPQPNESVEDRRKKAMSLSNALF